jgi:hypothetical protein
LISKKLFSPSLIRERPGLFYSEAQLGKDGNGEPYANHLDGPHSELFLVIPIRAWDNAQAARSVGAVKQ